MNSPIRISPTVAGLRIAVSMFASPVAVIVEIDAFCFAPAAVPPEDQPQLAADAYRVDAHTATAQLLEVIAGRTRNPGQSPHHQSSGACGRACFQGRMVCAATARPRRRRRAATRLESSRSRGGSMCVYVPPLGTKSNAEGYGGQTGAVRLALGEAASPRNTRMACFSRRIPSSFNRPCGWLEISRLAKPEPYCGPPCRLASERQQPSSRITRFAVARHRYIMSMLPGRTRRQQTGLHRYERQSGRPYPKTSDVRPTVSS